MKFLYSKVVIPACLPQAGEAGIHLPNKWIPVCTGMTKMLFVILTIITLIFNIQMSQAQNVFVQYFLGMPKPSSHLFEIGIRFDNIKPDDEYTDLIMPVWRPGRYLIFDFAGGVQEFYAEDFNAQKIKWDKIDKATWRVLTKGKTNLHVTYKVYANEFLLRTRGLDDKHAFVDGTAVFMYSEKFRDHKLTLEVLPYSDWHVTTGLDNISDDKDVFFAPNYDYFVDCPLEIGTQTDFDFEVDGKRHTISFYGEANYDKEKMKKDMAMIIKKEIDFWGNIPYDKYVFQIHCMPGNGGGTEHINSTILGANPKTFDSEKSYTNFLRLVAHEFFHTWNVKRLKPKGIARYDYTKENYTHELWISEGGTSYYDGLILTRTKQQPLTDFFKEIASQVQEERRRPGNRIQSVSESSFDAWVKFWKINPNRYNAESDYYGKGADVNLILDLEIRHRTNNEHSLDDVYRKMYEKFPPGSSGFTNDDFRKVCEDISGSSFKEFYDDYVWGTKPLEWETFLSYAGLELNADDSTATPVIGLKTKNRDGKIFVDDIISGSSAEQSGMMPGDEIISFDTNRLSYDEMEKRIKEMKTGESVSLFVFRGNELRRFILTMNDTRVPNYSVAKIKSPTEMQRRIYETWLEEKW